MPAKPLALPPSSCQRRPELQNCQPRNAATARIRLQGAHALLTDLLGNQKAKMRGMSARRSAYSAQSQKGVRTNLEPEKESVSVCGQNCARRTSTQRNSAIPRIPITRV